MTTNYFFTDYGGKVYYFGQMGIDAWISLIIT